ncbi:putative lipoprotein [Actinacidiphila reveromycinica]|uniref:Putative lipoprotein n=1 Tax=Actinacidiphila reveromycinica TaxID=659352 RepID=A0A7U3UVM2_9ACTN|nr:DUF3152 domain-containing protein [Streptomyces sp. SN-593]BBA99682.1 putative lipoprotein [Streptomyces sp. SN-593]
MGSRARRRRAAPRTGHGRASRRAPGHRGPYLVLGLAFLALLGVTLFAVRSGSRAHADTAPARAAGGHATPATPATPASPTTGTAPPPATGSPRPSVTPTVPTHGSGTFTTADASGEAVGHGDIRRYEVEVEGGTGVAAQAAAKEIQGILADPRGWTDDGRDGFQLVSSGPADFVVKIATPDTVDAICGAAGLHTHGEVNCDVGATVVVNLKRWLLGSPQFPGPIDDYRALIINHEVGHRIGHGHEGCPGAGRLAPVMMQQIDGLHGCKANAWPYDADGRYIQGPPVA